MRFSIKIFICTMLLVAAAFSAGGYLLISRNFDENVNREISRALEEHLSLRFMLESGIITVELQRRELTDEALREVAGQIAAGTAGGAGRILLHDRHGRRVYPVKSIEDDDAIRLQPLLAGQTKYRLEEIGGRYTLYLIGLFDYDGTLLYLSYARDVSAVFEQKDAQLKEFMLYDAIIVVASAAVLFLVSWLLTRPIRRLTATSRCIAGGEYGQRAVTHSTDEIGELAASFNRMADAVEDNINELKAAARKKDEFIANFTHELKTPMTSIIGYADMLRSKQCDGQTVFQAANTIFHEGRRLESLSLKLLDLILLENQAFILRPVAMPELLQYVAEAVGMAFAADGVAVTVRAADGMALAEPDLIKTLLINLADNARKASFAGGTVELSGTREADRYVLAVTDHGRGIPECELARITEAFYMVDKARARAQHGAGLGLAIASRIAELHGSALQIRSIVGLGTSVSISLTAYDALEECEGDEE